MYCMHLNYVCVHVRTMCCMVGLYAFELCACVRVRTKFYVPCYCSNLPWVVYWSFLSLVISFIYAMLYLMCFFVGMDNLELIDPVIDANGQQACRLLGGQQVYSACRRPTKALAFIGRQPNQPDWHLSAFQELIGSLGADNIQRPRSTAPRWVPRRLSAFQEPTGGLSATE